MLDIRDLSFAYGTRTVPVLHGVNMMLCDGEIGILLGKNGSGKTTLFKNILGLCTPISGSITFHGQDLMKMSKQERAGTITYVPQDIRFGALSVFDSFDEPTGNLDIANEQLIIDEARKVEKERKIGVLCSLHNLNRALNFGDRFFFLKNGTIAHVGGKEQFTEENIYDVFDIGIRIIQHEGETIILGGKKT